MKNYSIVRIGNEYVVQAGEVSVLKPGSRRRAVQLVSDAAELLNSHVLPRADQPADQASTQAGAETLITPDPPGSYLKPPKFLDDRECFHYGPRRDTSPQREACYLEG